MISYCIKEVPYCGRTKKDKKEPASTTPNIKSKNIMIAERPV
jgi:hypothetical protein